MTCLVSNTTSADDRALTVAECTDCTETTIGIIGNANLTDIDLARYFAAIDVIPDWVTGESKTPLGKNPGCAMLGLRFYEGLYGANLYRLYYARLQNGSDLIRGDLAGKATTYPAGSKTHLEAQDALYHRMNLSFATSQALLDAYQQQDCYTKEGVLQ